MLHEQFLNAHNYLTLIYCHFLFLPILTKMAEHSCRQQRCFNRKSISKLTQMLTKVLELSCRRQRYRNVN